MKSGYLAFLISSVIFLAIGIYTFFWFYVAQEVKQSVAAYIVDVQEKGFVLEGPEPTVNGFPGGHKISFYGRIKYGVDALEVPSITLSGLPVAGQDIEITLKEGLALSGQFDPEIWSLGFARIKIKVPAGLPEDFTVEGLRAWSASGGNIEIPEIEIRKRELTVRGSAVLMLDSQLQLAGTIPTRMSGNYGDFLGFLTQNNVIQTKQALLAGTVLAGLARKDEKTGETYLDATFTMQNSYFLLEPLRIAKLPEIKWPYRSDKEPPVYDIE